MIVKYVNLLRKIPVLLWRSNHITLLRNHTSNSTVYQKNFSQPVAKERIGGWKLVKQQERHLEQGRYQSQVQRLQPKRRNQSQEQRLQPKIRNQPQEQHFQKPRHQSQKQLEQLKQHSQQSQTQFQQLKQSQSLLNVGRKLSFNQFDRKRPANPKTNPSSFFTQVPSRFRLSQVDHHLQLMDYKLGGSWTDLHLSDTMIEALRSLGLARPNSMQMNVIPSLFRPAISLLCAAETGSGKTLAYLIPIMEKLKIEERDQCDDALRQVGYPRAVVLVPSNELIEQVYRVAKHLSHYVKLRIERITGTLGMEARRDALSKPIDLVITTPAQLLKSGLNLNKVKHLVIDEADSLLTTKSTDPNLSHYNRTACEETTAPKPFYNHSMAIEDDGDFGNQVNRLLTSQFGILPERDTTIICSATIPISLTKQLDTLFPNIIRLGSPRLHSVSDRISVRFLNVRLPGNVKLQKFEELLEQNRELTTLIFCNTTSHAARLHRLVTENDLLMERLGSVPSLLHGAIPEQQRHNLLKGFQNGLIKYLICTDLASRGLDTTQVSHVIMFDFPRNTIDFIHRMGRTGRLLGSRGLVSCLVCKRDQMLVQAIKQSIKGGQALTSPK